MENITIKPHHFMDIIKLYGSGLEKFVPDLKMEHDFYKVGNAILENKNIQLTLTTQGDDICKPCVKYQEHCIDELIHIPSFTRKNDYNIMLDKRIMALYHLEKDKYTAFELCSILYENMRFIFEVWKEENDEVTNRRFELFRKGAERYLELPKRI